MSNVATINTALALAITEDGQELPLVDGFGEDGQKCDIEDAVACTAGPDRDGKWLAIDLRHFEEVTVQ